MVKQSPYGQFDFVIGRNVLGQLNDEQRLIALANVSALLNDGASFCFAENIPQYSQRLADLVRQADVINPITDNDWLNKISDAENKIYNAPNDPIVNWNEISLLDTMKKAGFKNPTAELFDMRREFQLEPSIINHWFNPEDDNCYAKRLEKAGASQEDITKLKNCLKGPLARRLLFWETKTAIIRADAK